ncbi:hypothetical protein VNO77_02447 [Canavalia gladiata]|uniref:Uncharacterized protein n=1 Tax=Canavalia gladiata TaxID=3824 RepID=A0AAN9RBB1_CANGL
MGLLGSSSEAGNGSSCLLLTYASRLLSKCSLHGDRPLDSPDLFTGLRLWSGRMRETPLMVVPDWISVVGHRCRSESGARNGRNLLNSYRYPSRPKTLGKSSLTAKEKSPNPQEAALNPVTLGLFIASLPRPFSLKFPFLFPI